MKKYAFTMILMLLVCDFAAAETVDKIVAKVGSEVITMNDLNVAVQSKRISLMQLYGENNGALLFNRFKNNALQEIILQKVLELEIKREKITVGDGSVESEYQERLRQSGMSEPEFLGNLAKTGLALGDYKNNVRREIEERQFVDKKIMPNVFVSDFDLQKEYQKNISKYQIYTKFRFTEAFLTSDTFPNEEALLGKARLIRDGMVHGNSVSALIAQYSSGAFREKGGDSGLVDAASLRKEISTVLSSLKVGETSELIPVEQGVFVFKLLSKSDPKPLPFSAVVNVVRARYSEKIVHEELKKYLMAIKDETYVEVLK